MLAAEQIRVMQWNIHGNLGTLADNSAAQAQAIARIVNYNQPDVLLLNEVQYASLTANTAALIDWVTNNVPYLGSQPGVTFFVAVSSITDGFNRNGAISRFPILNQTTYDDGLRGLHAFQVQLSTTNLQIFHAHLKALSDSAACTKRQTEAQYDSDTIKAFAATNSLPYIFGGDWNEDEDPRDTPECTITGTYHPITTIMTNGGFAEFEPTTLSGKWWTYITKTYTNRLDYLLAATNRVSPPTGFVFNSTNWAAFGLYTNASSQNLVGDSHTASDHFCVFADYSFSAPVPNLAVSPTGSFASTGNQGGPFSPSSQTYTLTNSGSGSLNWTATKTANWLALSAASGILAAGVTTNVTVSVNANANSLAANTYSDTLSFTNSSNGAGNTTRAVSLTVNPTPAQLAVGPASGFSPSGYVGGPFSPSSQSYSLTNLGGTTLNWTASITANWLNLSVAGGTLAAGATTNVTVSINANANSLAANIYSGTVSFTNTSNGAGNTTRAVSLTVNPTPAQLAVGPASGFSSSGYVGGPFGPSSQTYSLTNLGGTTLNWTASITANWLSLSATNGALAAGVSTNVAVSINANANSLAANTYSDTVGFTNTSNGMGDTTRPAGLTINPIPPPVAFFAASPTNGAGPLTVAFTDTSSGNITNRFWDFGDGSTTNTTATNLTHVYTAGTYGVTLAAMGPGGAATNSQPNYVSVLTPFQAWQVLYLGSTTNPDAAAAADADNDRMSNWSEFLAGTNPTNSASAIRITTVAQEGDDLRVTWTLGSGKTNVLQRADGLAGTDSFADVFTVLTASSVTNYLDVGAGTNAAARYYRVWLGP